MTVKTSPEWLDENRGLWDERARYHPGTDFYDLDSFLGGRSSLNRIELDELPDISGKDLLHLQCHFGQDSISLARMGARVTGLDFSPVAIETARGLALKTGTGCRFVCADVYSAPTVIKEHFDMVFTSYGTIGWLPDLKAWARVVSGMLRPGGVFYMAEFHPFLWIWDDDFNRVVYPYTASEEIVEELESSYAGKEKIAKRRSHTWNHGLGDVLGALTGAGLSILHLNEYNYSPYGIFPEMESPEPGKFRLKKFGDKVPMVYTVLAQKSGGSK